MKNPTCQLVPALTLATWTALSLPAGAATNTDWIDDPDNRGTETEPIDLYSATKWSSGVLPSSDYNLHFTAAGRTYVTNTATKKIATALRFVGGDFVMLGSLSFSSFNYSDNGSFSETDPVSIDKRGDWECTGYFRLAAKDGASFVLTNRTGNLVTGTSSGQYPARLGNGNNSTSVLVLVNGDVRAPNTSAQYSIAYGAGSTARFEQNGGSATFGNRLQIAYGSNSTGTYELNGGTVCVTNALYVGVNGAGVLTVNGGTFTSIGTTWLGQSGGDSSGNINLNGGTFETPYICVPAKNGGGTILFNGGTLRAAYRSDNSLIEGESRILVRIGERGGTIDTAGLEIRYPKKTSAADGVTNDGGLAIVGGGTFNVTGSASNPRLEYGGKTTIEVGTRVTIPTTTIGGGAVFTIPPGLGRGVYVPLSVSGNYSLESIFNAAELPNDPDARFELSQDKKRIFCYYKVDGLQDPYWIGEVSGDLGVGANWSTGTVPQGGNCYIGCDGANATLTCSASFRPDSITFLDGSNPVTINGTDDIAGITVITNLSAVNHTINVPVRFVDKIRVQQAAKSYNSRVQPHVVFEGGAYGTTIDADYSLLISGHYFLSDDTGAWTVTGYQGEAMCGLQEGSSISVPYVTNISQIFSGGSGSEDNGGAVTVGVYRTSARICRFNNGTAEFVVTNELYCTLTGDNNLSYRYSDGWFKFEKFTIGKDSGNYKFHFANSGNNGTSAYQYRKYVRLGAGGLVFEDGLTKSPSIQFGRNTGDYVTLAPWHGDFTFGTKGQAGKADLTFFGTSSTFDTTDESGIGRTITLDALCAGTKSVTVTGKGTLVVNNQANTCSGAVTVNDTATLALNAGCPFGTGRVTVTNATLKANSSGTVAFASNVVCQAGTALAFRFTDKRTAPCLAFNAEAAGNAMPAELAVRVSAADGLLPVGRQHTLTTGYDFTGKNITLVDPPDWIQSIGKDASGNIVLDVKSNGTTIIMR